MKPFQYFKTSFSFLSELTDEINLSLMTNNAKEIHNFSNTALMSNFQHFQVTVEFFYSAICFTRLSLLLGSKVLYH